MSTEIPRLRPSAAVLAAAFGFAWFLARFHLGALDVQNIGWLMTGDFGQNELGWLFLRKAPWMLPLGSTPTLLHPVGTSVALTDSTPLLALAFKLVERGLPEAFQYMGPWLALCFAFQGAAGALLTSAFTPSRGLQALGGVLFALSPALANRVGHPSLCAHFLLLVLIWLGVRRLPGAAGARGTLAAAIAVTVLAALIHPYLWLMCAALATAVGVRLLLEHRIRPMALALAGAGMLAVDLGVFWLLGLVGRSVDSEAVGFDHYTADLLTLVNPMHLSRLLPTLPAGPGQYEGTAFLGLGGLVLTLGAGLVLIARRSAADPDARLRWGPLFVAAVVLAIFSAGSVITLAGHPIATARGFYRHLGPLVNSFRAAGRFIWPLHDLVLASGLAVVIGALRGRPRLALGALGLVVALQLGDLQLWPFDTRPTEKWNVLRSPRWDALAEGRAHVVLVPTQLHVGGGEGCPDEDAHPRELYLSAGWLAYRHGMSINSGYAARVDPKRMKPACAALLDDVDAGRWDPSALYLVADGWADRFEGKPGITCERLDGVLTCVAAPR